jgi:hypothetical protein
VCSNNGWDGAACDHDCSSTAIGIYATLSCFQLGVAGLAVRKLYHLQSDKTPGAKLKRLVLYSVGIAGTVRAIQQFAGALVRLVHPHSTILIQLCSFVFSDYDGTTYTPDLIATAGYGINYVFYNVPMVMWLSAAAIMFASW